MSLIGSNTEGTLFVKYEINGRIFPVRLPLGCNGDLIAHCVHTTSSDWNNRTLPSLCNWETFLSKENIDESDWGEYDVNEENHTLTSSEPPEP